tara:strand:+ start:480 stop:632 length:153 start_codon:yes stop_codon:yes gene_type:complete
MNATIKAYPTGSQYKASFFLLLLAVQLELNLSSSKWETKPALKGYQEGAT